MTTTKTLRAGVIGCGEIGQRGHIPGFKEAGVDVMAVCDTNLPRAKETAEKNNIPNAYGHYGELLAE